MLVGHMPVKIRADAVHSHQIKSNSMKWGNLAETDVADNHIRGQQ